MQPRCPECGNSQLAPYLSEDAVRLETILRAQFVFDRVEKNPKPEERKDLTSFAHGAAASLAECPRCSILVRVEQQNEPNQTYVDDPYDPAAIDRLLPRYIDAFRAKEQPYRSLLAEGATVVEIGPHFGAFLHVARDWGWHSTGIDIGKDTTRYIRDQGFAIQNCSLEECRLPAASHDGVFIWNCFEQIPDAHSTLEEARRILKPGGLLILRTPNALFYRVCQDRLKATPDSDLSLWIVRSLGYNNLLAFPYLYGYSSDSLARLGAAHGFRCEAALNAELITLPFPELPDWVVDENRAAYALIRQWSELEEHERNGRLTAPWIELILRAVGSLPAPVSR